jgi:hypothetical protein
LHIDASAATRIDLAGGTLDIWRLCLDFHIESEGLRVESRVAA